MRFTKMQGIGNDYVYVNCFEEQVTDPEEAARLVSDRRRKKQTAGWICTIWTVPGE